jgi:hypothetical protein
MPKADGGDAQRVTRGSQNPELRPTLEKQGIDKNLAKRARNARSVPEDQFEKLLGEGRQRIKSESERTDRNLSFGTALSTSLDGSAF